jgi:chromosome partitioning protein
LTIAIDHGEARLKTQLQAVISQYDHVIIDCPPALSWLTINAFTASDKVLVPGAPGYFELDSIVQIGKTIQEVRLVKAFKDALNISLHSAGKRPLSPSKIEIVAT